jgi:hypothetical protein
MKNKTIQLWHGGRFHSSNGPMEIQKAKTGKVEHGVGIYTSTHLSTATKYAKGGGHVTYIELDPNIQWMENSDLDINNILMFIKNTQKLRHRQSILDDFKDSIERSGKEGNRIFASVLVNLCHYHNALVGDTSKEITHFYRENGIHASLVKSGSEDWVLIFDPSKIIKAKSMPIKIIERDFSRQFDSVKTQLENINKNDEEQTAKKQDKTKIKFKP